MNIDKAKLAVIAKQYAYAAITAVSAALAMGVTDPKKLAAAAAVGVLGPIVAAANPKDDSIGVGAAKLIVHAAEKELGKPVKKAVNKAAK
jgi:hypothetical protein